jgi:hypothetical protein
MKGNFMSGGELIDPKRGDGELARTQAGEAQLARTIQEVKAMVLIAKEFPRDEQRAARRIQEACRRVQLAEDAEYEYPRGDTRVTGASIRLAEVLATAWGNIDYGFVVVDQRLGRDSDILAYAWDLESNVRASRRFTQKHIREKKSGNVILTDPRDVYECEANHAQRRVRAAILAVIPRDVTDFAVEECRKTMRDADKRPTHEKIQQMLTSFGELGVTADQLTSYLRHALGATTDREFLQLKRIYSTIKDGIRKAEDYFAVVDGARPAGQTKAQKMGAEVKKPAENKPAGETPGAGATSPVPAPAGEKKKPGRPPSLKNRIAAMDDKTMFTIKSELDAMPEGEQRQQYQQQFDERLNQLDAEKQLQAAEQVKNLAPEPKAPESGGLFQRQPGDEDEA